MASRKHTTPAQLELSLATEEEWRAIPGYEGLYEVSNLGRIKNARPISTRKRHPENQRRGGRIMLQSVNRDGYHVIKLCKDGMAKLFRVHSLVLHAFIGPSLQGMVCNHLDGNRTNNVVGNLEWTTPAGNRTHTVHLGRQARGERHPQARLTAAQVLEIRRLASEGKPWKVLAQHYNVYPSTIRRIVVRLAWTHLP